MIRCKLCGAQVRDDARFCKLCGAVIETAIQPSAIKIPEVKKDENKDLFQAIREIVNELEPGYKELKKENETCHNKIVRLNEMIDEKSEVIGRLKKEIERLQEELKLKEEQLVFVKAAMEEDDNSSAKECPNCHAVIDEEAVFCGECGFKIELGD